MIPIRLCDYRFRGRVLGSKDWVYGDLQIGDDDHIPMIGVVGPGALCRVCAGRCFYNRDVYWD